MTVRANENGGPYWEYNVESVGTGRNGHPVLLDPFGNAYRYRNFTSDTHRANTDPGTAAGLPQFGVAANDPYFPEMAGRVVIYSCGPNGVDEFGWGDDIVSSN